MSMARYAEIQKADYCRLETVSMVGDSLRVLDITDPDVRTAVSDSEDADSVYASNAAFLY